jgi:DnaJ-class molecular chaperone
MEPKRHTLEDLTLYQLSDRVLCNHCLGTGIYLFQSQPLWSKREQRCGKCDGSGVIDEIDEGVANCRRDDYIARGWLERKE